jgi:hypothetical protein
VLAGPAAARQAAGTKGSTHSRPAGWTCTRSPALEGHPIAQALRLEAVPQAPRSQTWPHGHTVSMLQAGQLEEARGSENGTAGMEGRNHKPRAADVQVQADQGVWGTRGGHWDGAGSCALGGWRRSSRRPAGPLVMDLLRQLEEGSRCQCRQCCCVRRVRGSKQSTLADPRCLIC